MLAVPAAIACADVGDIVDARRHLAVAESSAALWEGSAWEAAVCEARAHLARAEGREDEFTAQLARAAMLFHAVGHHRDAVALRTYGRDRRAVANPGAQLTERRLEHAFGIIVNTRRR